ncbi:hypothetical protein JCM11491_005008 [Sporobolomyces phaffii]
MDVLRAMSFGVLSSSDDHRDRDRARDSHDAVSSRSSSKNRFSKQLSRESTLELDDSLGLERSLSRLSVVSSLSGASHSARPATSILINRSRPSSPQPPTTRSLSYEPDLTASAAAPAPAAFVASTSVGSVASSSAELAHPPGGARPPAPLVRTHSSTSSGAASVVVRDESVERSKPKIKFAPLPQIRPRSYSTGRNVWAERDGGGDDDDGGGGDDRHLVRREDGRRVHPSDRGFGRDDDGCGDGTGHYDFDDYDDDDDDGGRGYGSSDDDEQDGASRSHHPRRQSWTDTLGMGSVWGLNSSSNGGGGGGHSKRDHHKGREVDEDAVSLASGNGSDYGLSSSGGGGTAGVSKDKDKETLGGKILKPFLFGRRKSTTARPSKPTPSVVEPSSGGLLSRTSSGESRHSSPNDTPGPPTPTNQGTRPKGTTGIPMRKASTWDSTNSAGSKGSTATATTKAKSKHQTRSSLSAAASTSLPRDPTTTPQIIYYASPSRSARPARRAQYPPVAQRSRTAPKPIRQSKVDEPEFSEWGSVGSVGSVQSRGSAKSNGDDDEDGSGMAWIRRRRKEREEKEKRDRELAALSPEPTTSDELAPQGPAEQDKGTYQEADKENEVAQRAIGRTPKRQSTVDSTFSMTSSTSTIRPASPKIMSGLSLSRPAENVENDNAQGSPEGSQRDEEEDEVARVASEDEEEESEDEEDEESRAKEEDDDDLDAEELEREEALADAARRSAKGAGAERYHSTTHESMLHVPTNDTITRQPSQQLRRTDSVGSALV